MITLADMPSVLAKAALYMSAQIVSKYKKRQKHRRHEYCTTLYLRKNLFLADILKKTIPVTGKSNKDKNMLIRNSSVTIFFSPIQPRWLLRKPL